MKCEFVDLSAKKYGFLTVIKLMQNGKTRRSWLVECDCGNQIIIGEAKLLGLNNRRPNKSCGCKQATRDKSVVKYPRIYYSWNSMINSCYNSSSDNYERYGEKGIKVCEEWRNSFENFLNWSLNNGYDESLYLNRINIEKDFYPDNCNYTDRFNHMQKRGILKSNRSGSTGIAYYPEKSKPYKVSIARNNIRKYLGSYKEISEAEKVRQQAEEYFKLHGTIENFKLNKEVF